MSTATDKPESIREEVGQPRTAAISVRALREEDLAEADRIFRVAFGTFIGLPDPASFCEGREFVRPRWRANRSATLAAECEGELIGSNLATGWGTVGFFGPLTVRPDFWDRSVGRRLLEATMPLLEGMGVRHAGLFTFPQSPKHVGLYQKFGFAPRFLTAVMVKPAAPLPCQREAVKYSELTESQQEEVLRACGELTELLCEGLSLESEIRSVRQHRLGDTLLLWEGSRLGGFAVCHYGAGTEGGAGCCYVKFAAARPGPGAGQDFDYLLDACETLAIAQGLPTIEAGVNLVRGDAHRRMLMHGFRAVIQGVLMHKPNRAPYHDSDVYVIDDWR